MADDNFPSHPDSEAFRYASGPLGPKMMGDGIGGTHNVSTKISPQQALTGGYQPINGDGTPNPLAGGAPYLPGN